MIDRDVVNQGRELLLCEGRSRIDVGREKESVYREVGVVSEG